MQPAQKSTQQPSHIEFNSETITIPVQEVTGHIAMYVNRLLEVMDRVQTSVTQFFNFVQNGLRSVLGGCVAINRCVESLQNVFIPRSFTQSTQLFSDQSVADLLKKMGTAQK